jgi:hypothetical protein
MNRAAARFTSSAPTRLSVETVVRIANREIGVLRDRRIGEASLASVVLMPDFEFARKRRQAAALQDVLGTGNATVIIFADAGSYSSGFA